MGKAQEKPARKNEFTRFRNLAGKIVAVPKAEVDKQREQHEKEKGKRPAHK